MKNTRLIFLLLLFAVTAFTACRKSYIPAGQDPGSRTGKDFFNSHRSADPEEERIVAFIRGKNKITPFVEATIAKIGYPRWDKMLKGKPGTKSATIKLDGKSQGIASAQSTSDVYYIPFVRDNEDHVNASMVVKATRTDTTICYICDWQYTRSQNDVNQLNDKAENMAIFFMAFDNRVFGHTEFAVKDKSLFRTDGHDAVKIKLVSKPATQGVKTNYMATFCQGVTITFTACPYIPMYGLCSGETYCDNCYLCTGSLSYDYCWEDWVWDDDGGGGGGGGGGGTGGGGGGGGGGTPPGPCDPPPGGGEAPTAAKAKHNPGIKTNKLPCEDGPGWEPEPDPYSDEKLEEMGNNEGWYWNDPAYFDPVTIYDPNTDGPVRPDGFRRNGPLLQFNGGTVQNWIDDSNGKKVATFISTTTGVATDFPDAYISDNFTPKNRAYTTANKTIRADNTFNLADLQHEYGHVLQIKTYGVQFYVEKIMPASLISMIRSSSNHKNFWTEKSANQLAIAFFGSSSPIALDPANFPR